MKKLSVGLAFSIPFVTGCLVGNEPGTGDEHGDPPNPPVTGTITTDTVWMGTQPLEGTTVINDGVTVTVKAGTTLQFAQGAVLTVSPGAALVVNGTSAEPVLGKPATGATGWGGITVGGALTLNYANLDGGSISTSGAGAMLTIADSKMVNASGDYVIINGGSINMMYSQVGPDDGATSSTHCNFHINSATTISVIHTNINGSPYGLMLYGGFDANFQYNNWYGNSAKDVDTKSGVMGNVSFGYFEKGAPTPGPGATITADGLSTSKVPAGPR